MTNPTDIKKLAEQKARFKQSLIQKGFLSEEKAEG